MMHERMAYWVARQAGGIPASRANHAQLTINGQPYGLYTNVETVKKRILRRWFPTTRARCSAPPTSTSSPPTSRSSSW